MLWPFVLPAQITCCLMLACLALLTAVAPSLKWKRSKAFVISLVTAILLFVPSCIGVMAVVDSYRFSTFQYARFTDVKDIRIDGFLPPKATDITLMKLPGGHRAKYSISEEDLRNYIETLWMQTGSHQSEQQGKQVKETAVNCEVFELRFKDSGWTCHQEMIEMEGPREPNGRGAVYYYDRLSKTAYHTAGYW